MMTILRFGVTLAKYVGFVSGGVTLFLILAPMVGYLPYSDRPGPGWYGAFPALGLDEFLKNSWNMLGFGLFLAVLLVIPAALAILLVRGLEWLIRPPIPRRIAAGFVCGLIAGYCMLGAGWYIAAGTSLFVISAILGAVAGAWFVSRTDSAHRAERVT